MAEYAINKGIGRSVEYKGLKAQLSVHLRRGLACPVRGVRNHVYIRRFPMVLHRVRRYCRLSSCVAHLPPQCQVRAIWSDETDGGEVSPPLHHQPSPL